MVRRVIRLSVTMGLLALGLFLIPSFASSQGVPAPESEPAGGPLGPVMRVLLVVNASWLLRLVILLCLSAAAVVAMFWRRLGERGPVLLILLDGFAVLWLALQLWGIFSAVSGG